MTQQSLPSNVDPMIYAWTDTFENPTCAEDLAAAAEDLADRHDRDDRDDPWTEAATIMSPPCYESTRLDAASLFDDLDLAALPRPSVTLPASVMLPPPAAEAPMFTPPITIPPPVITYRREAPTVRLRALAADPQRARLVAFVICGSVALVAALAACFLYAAA